MYNRYPILEAIQRFYLAGKGVVKISEDSSAARSTNNLITEKAIKDYIDASGGGSGTPDGSYIINGAATWSGTGLIFDWSDFDYVINGVVDSSNAIQHTLDPADPVLNRIDVLYVGLGGTTGFITGVPDVNPIKPQVDPATQLEVSIVFVPAGATTPMGVSNQIVFDEGGESTPSSNAAGSNFAYGVGSFHGVINARVTSFTNGQYVKFVLPGNLNISDYPFIKFNLFLPSSFASGTFFSLYLYNGLVATTQPLNINSGSFGFTRTQTGVWQQIQIPTSALVLLADSFNTVYLRLNGTSGTGFQLDYMYLQAGTTTTAPNGVQSFNGRVGHVIPIMTDYLPALDAGKYLTNNGTTLSWGTMTAGWGLTGNTGTSPSTHWIGTNDNVGFMIRTGGMNAVQIYPLYGAPYPSFRTHFYGQSGGDAYIEAGNSVATLGLGSSGAFLTLTGEGLLEAKTNTYLRFKGASSGSDNIIFTRNSYGSGPGNIFSARYTEADADGFAFRMQNSSTAYFAVGFGWDPANQAHALAEFSSTTQGMLFPRMTTTQKNAIPTPGTSLLVFDTTTGKYEYYTGSAWTPFATGSGGTPGGSNTYVQYNNAGAFGGSYGFRYIDAGGQGNVHVVGSITAGYTGVAYWVNNGNAIRNSAATNGTMYIDASQDLSGTISFRATTLSFGGYFYASSIGTGGLSIAGSNSIFDHSGAGVLSWRIRNSTTGVEWYIENHRNLSGALEFGVGIYSDRALVLHSNNQVGVNLVANNGTAQFQVDSTTRGILIPRMTTTQKNAIGSPATSLLVFDTTIGNFEYYTGSTWSALGGGGGGGSSKWTDTGSDIYRNSNVMIGSADAPTSLLHIKTSAITTPDDAKALFLENSTVSVAGVPQYSPSLIMRGHGRESSASTPYFVDFRINHVPYAQWGYLGSTINFQIKQEGSAYYTPFYIDWIGATNAGYYMPYGSLTVGSALISNSVSTVTIAGYSLTLNAGYAGIPSTVGILLNGIGAVSGSSSGGVLPVSYPGMVHMRSSAWDGSGTDYAAKNMDIQMQFEGIPGGLGLDSKWFKRARTNAGGYQDIETLYNTGKKQYNKYGVGTFAGTAVYGLGVDASGNLVETGATGSGISIPLDLSGPGGANYPQEKLYIYNQGDKMGFGMANTNPYFQFFVRNGDSFSWNGGAGLNTAGTNQWMALSSSQLTVAGGLSIGGAFTAGQLVTTGGMNIASVIDFGGWFIGPRMWLYNGGATDRIGYGAGNSEPHFQFFCRSGSSAGFTWNKGGDLQSVGTNELMRLTVGSGLQVESSVYTPFLNFGSGYNVAKIYFRDLSTPGYNTGLAVDSAGGVQNFILDTSGRTWSWHGGGDYQTSGVNKKMELDGATGNLWVLGGLTIGGSVTLPSILQGATLNQVKAMYYDGGGSTYQAGVAFVSDLGGPYSYYTQFFTFNVANTGWSWNGGGGMQTPGTNELMRLHSTGELTVNGSFILNSTTRGLRFPRMTTTQKNAIASPVNGDVVYDTTLAKLCVYTTAWETITST